MNNLVTLNRLTIKGKKYSTEFWMLVFLFPVSCIFDIYNGYTNLYFKHSATISLFYKGLVLIICLYRVINYKRALQWVLLAILLFAICLLYWIVSGNLKISISTELIDFMKISYPYAIMLYLYTHKDHIKEEDLIKCIKWFGMIAVLSLFGSILLGINVNSYGRENAYQFGTKGLFTAGNDIGLSLILVNAIACYSLVTRFVKYNLFLVIFISVGASMIGSIAGVGGTLLLFVALVYYLMVYGKNVLSKTQRFFLQFILFFIVGYILYKFLVFILSDKYFYFRIQSMLSGGSRASLEEGAKQVLNRFTIGSWLFGHSASGFRAQLASQLNMTGYRLTEMDFYDLIGYYGITLGGLMITYSFYFLIRSFRFFIKSKEPLLYWTTVGLALFIGHGFLAGHAYTSPTSGLIYAGIVGLVIKKTDKNRLIRS